MGGPDMPRPGTPAARAMEADRFGPPVPGAPPPRDAPITIAPPRKRPRAGVIPSVSLPAEPPPMRGPGQRVGGPDSPPMGVMARAQMWQKLPGTSDVTGIPGPDMAAFRTNYRATHKARLSPAQEMLLARYMWSQNPDNLMFGDPQTLGLGR